MLHAAVLRSPHAHGRVTDLDLDAARAVPGVRAVLGPEPSLLTSPAPLLVDEPEYAGQPIAVVAADSDGRRRGRGRALALAVEALPLVVDPRRGAARAALHARPVRGGSRRRRRRAGRADVRIELELETPGHLQTPLEPHAAVAWWHGDQLTAWVSTQGMFAARDELGRPLRPRAREQVRVITEYVGGGFGGKQGAGTEALLAAELSRLTGRPVRVVNDRHAEQLDGGRRASTRQRVRLGARRDGTLVAVDADAVVAMGQGGWLLPVLVPAMTLYRCDNVRGMAFPLKVNLRARTPSARPA